MKDLEFWHLPESVTDLKVFLIFLLPQTIRF